MPRHYLGCQCTPKDRSRWAVITRKGNFSAFNGYRFSRSDYSSVTCLGRHGGCGAVWRTKAAYTDTLPDVPLDWAERGV